MSGRLWSGGDIALLRELYPHHPTSVVAMILKRSVSATYGAADLHGLKKTEEYLASPAACRLRRDEGPTHPGFATQFRKGQVPHNKGVRRPGHSPGRMSETQFKKGNRTGAAARNWQPIGTVRVDPEGYRRIKVREALPGEAYGFGNVRVWPLLHRHIWEKHHGPIPAGHTVCFADGDRSRCEISNLELVARRDLMLRNTVHNLPKEIAELVQLRGALNRKINRRAKKQA